MYTRLLQKYPLITRCTTSGFLFSISDALTQKFIEKKQKIDIKRNFNMALTATFYLGPFLHYWYGGILPKLLGRAIGVGASKIKGAFVGMLMDQLGASPIYAFGWFILANWIEDFTVASAKFGLKEAKQKIVETLISCYKVWPGVVMLNLFFVPIAYQALFINTISVLWNMYMSYITYRR